MHHIINMNNNKLLLEDTLTQTFFVTFLNLHSNSTFPNLHSTLAINGEYVKSSR